MRIAYMHTSPVALAERMAARGHDVAIVILRPHEAHEWPATVQVVRLDMKNRRLPQFKRSSASENFCAGFRWISFTATRFRRT